MILLIHKNSMTNEKVLRERKSMHLKLTFMVLRLLNALHCKYTEDGMMHIATEDNGNSNPTYLFNYRASKTEKLQNSNVLKHIITQKCNVYHDRAGFFLFFFHEYSL